MSAPQLTVEQRLDLAKDLIQRGEEFYARAAEHLGYLKKQGWTHAALGREVGKGKDWVRELLAWASDREDPRATPFAGQYEERIERAGRQVLRDPEKLKQAVESLTPEERVQVAAAAMPHPIEREPEPVEIPGPPERKGTDPAQYEIDEHLIRAQRELKIVADRIEKYGVRSIRPSELSDVVESIVDLVAGIAPKVTEAVRQEIQQ